MVKRSLQACLGGMKQAKRSFSLKGWTQENLAGEVNLKTRQPIWRFFTGKPVDRQIFLAICGVLDLDWREVARQPPAEFPNINPLSNVIPIHSESQSIDELVQLVRSQRHESIQTQCGILNLLDTNRPVRIDDIYVDVNILEEIASQQWFEIEELQNIDPVQFDRIGMGSVEQQQISGIQAVETYSKLRVLGKPGVGKTTFLQHLAILCNRGEFAANQVPIFIALRDFAEESRDNGKYGLLNYIHQTFLAEGIGDPAIVETLLKTGRVLLLLDGMDEILNQDSTAVLKEIRKFLDRYPKNQFVISCRTAINELQLQGFTDVEIAPFTKSQINTFAQKWFGVFAKTSLQSGPDQSIQFMQKLELPENRHFRQLVRTPLFLHLACWMFHGQNVFPTKRAEFYKQGLDLLLGKWDESKGLGREDGYRGFLLPQKLRLLSQLATVTFEKGQYFFEHQVIAQYISDYLRSLPNATLDPEELQFESEAILKDIETQYGLLTERARGIFSFSYLVFQEYLTARKIVASHNLSALDQSLGRLVSHITDRRWHEVFLLTATMLRNADSLVQLMKQQIDALVAQDPYLQDFLIWASQKSQTIASPPQISTTRAFCLSLAQSPDSTATSTLASTLDQGVLLDSALQDLLLEFTIDRNPDVTYLNTCYERLTTILVTILDAGFYKSLQQLRDQLPPVNQSLQRRQGWWKSHYMNWLEQLRGTIAQYRNINHPWQFRPEQQRVLQGYYDANQLLMDCLNSNCEITTTIRQEIETSLLLPQKELEDREWTRSY
jgi:predicted NACHT family NTPase